jgi:RNA recognition motif-containing protein
MATKLYVGGIPYSSTEQTLGEAFSRAGNVVSTAIIIDRMTGRSKGFGFVEMSTEEEAQKAIEIFNGQDFEGRKLTVNVARPLEPRNGDRRGM